MKGTQYIVVGLFIFCALQACTERTICPAYQSAFIHDKEQLEKRFSYFKEDSTPKILSASKDRFLIIEEVSYKKKLKSLQTIPMQDVYPQEEDSLEFNDKIELAEREYGYDSTAVISEDTVATAADSIYMISLKKEKFNIDQELYLWYLKDYLVYPDVRLQLEENAEAQAEAMPDSVKKKKKGFFGFFKNLFKKKDKSDTTSVDNAIPAADGEVEEEKKEKKGFRLFKKKKKKKKSSDEPEENNEEATEEEQDDGEDDF